MATTSAEVRSRDLHGIGIIVVPGIAMGLDDMAVTPG
jgi:hypothetical protein